MGPFCPPFWDPLFCLLERSWTRSGPKKTSLERLLAGPRRIPRQISAILGAKRLPKGRPRASKIESKRRLELKKRFLQKPLFFFQYNLMNVEVPTSPFGGQNRCKMASDCIFGACWLLNASFLPLGPLLEAFGAEKK